MFPLWVLPYRFVGVIKSEGVYYNNTVVIIAHRCCLCFYLLVVLFNMLICPRCGRVGIGIYEKRVKGHRYLYCAHRLDGRLKWCYIGKLSNSLPNSLPNFLKQRRDWCGGWDSNPRSPSAADLKSAPSGRMDLALCPGSGTPAL